MSEVTRFREQQQLQEESAQLALFGPAAMARHDAVISRMQPGQRTLVQLFGEGRDDEAFALWNAGILEGK
jgi:hypothetical protein